MITHEQALVLRNVLRRFLKNEIVEWTEFDDSMEYLDYLEDSQLVIEAQICLEMHMKHNARCTHNHPREECFVPTILDAVSYILDDYDQTKKLVKTTRYMLQYYLALRHTGAIISD